MCCLIHQGHEAFAQPVLYHNRRNRRLAAIPMSSYDPPFQPPIWGLGWTYRVENGTTQNLVPIFLFDFYTHYMPAYLAPFGHNTQQGRQSERNRQQEGPPIGGAVRSATSLIPQRLSYTILDITCSKNVHALQLTVTTIRHQSFM